MRNRIHVWVCICLLAALQCPGAQDKDLPVDGSTLQASPDSIGAVILGQNVQMMTRDGTYLKGKVLRAAPTEITFRVKECEPRNRMQGSEAVIPTSEISVVYLRKNGTIALPIVMGVVGALGAMFGAAFTTEGLTSDAAVISIMLASAAGGATGGALLGREAGKKTVPINVGPRP